MNAFWSLSRRMLRYRAALLGALGMALVSAGSMGAGLVGLLPVLDKVLGKDRAGLPELATRLNESSWVAGRIPPQLIAALPEGPVTALVAMMLGLGVLTVIGATGNFLHVYLSLTLVNRTIAGIRREVFHRVVRMPLAAIIAAGGSSEPSTGSSAGGGGRDEGGPSTGVGGASDTVSRLINDCNGLGQGLNALLSKAVAQVTKGVAALGAAVYVDLRLTLAALIAGVVAGVIIRKLGKRIRRASRAALESQADLYGVATEALQGLRVVKVHGAERFEAGRFHRINKSVMHELNRVRTARALASPLIETLAVFTFGALAVVMGKAILDNHVDPSEFILTMASLGVAGGSLKPLTGILGDIQTSAAAADRLAELTKTRPEPGHDLKLPKLARHAQSIEFRGVTFHYPRSNRPSLSNVSLTIQHGETVAFVGPNGSGKTTLLALVPRLFDPDPNVGGQVLIDGRDVRLFSVRSLRRQIGVVTQETILFKGTIRGNIAYGAENATEERIIHAAQRARAHEFITQLTGGYDAAVGEQGLTLSGGQRQRLAIARAMLRDPAILILDEATSMIDADSEAKIAEALQEFSRGRTSLIVAHRLSTVISADRIVVMDQGRIVDVGRHGELMKRCTVYRSIAERQLLSPG
ncbi:MAG: ABC transporter ATP-binding protein [Planctomycetota bacterium]|nr:ABC transporter ATP-binding protein [Planctomycetota bacterium]